MIKVKNYHIWNIGIQMILNNFYGWAMSQKFPVNGFECVKETSQFN